MVDKNEIQVGQVAKLLRLSSLKALEDAYSLFISDLANRPDSGDPSTFLWIKELSCGLGLTHSGLADKLDITRKAARDFAMREKTGTITLESLRKIASAYDCEFVYSFRPINYNTFAEMIAAKTLPFVIEPLLPNEIHETRRAEILAVRIKKFLKHPTGRGQIWQVQSALKRNYHYTFADYWHGKWR